MQNLFKHTDYFFDQGRIYREITVGSVWQNRIPYWNKQKANEKQTTLIKQSCVKETKNSWNKDEYILTYFKIKFIKYEIS